MFHLYSALQTLDTWKRFTDFGVVVFDTSRDWLTNLFFLFSIYTFLTKYVPDMWFAWILAWIADKCWCNFSSVNFIRQPLTKHFRSLAVDSICEGLRGWMETSYNSIGLFVLDYYDVKTFQVALLNIHKFTYRLK